MPRRKKSKSVRGNHFPRSAMGNRRAAWYKNAFKQSSQNKVYKFVQAVDGATITGLGARAIVQGNVVSNRALYFTLGDCAQSATFTGLFDQYRIDKIVIDFIPMTQMNNFSVGTAVGNVNNPGLFGTIVDYDDATALTTLADYEQFPNFKYQPCISMRTHRRSFRPHIAVGAYNGAFAGYKNEPAGWIDCATNSIQHYGIKIFWDGYANANALQTFQVMCKYHLSFKNVR